MSGISVRSRYSLFSHLAESRTCGGDFYGGINWHDGSNGSLCLRTLHIAIPTWLCGDDAVADCFLGYLVACGALANSIGETTATFVCSCFIAGLDAWDLFFKISREGKIQFLSKTYRACRKADGN